MRHTVLAIGLLLAAAGPARAFEPYTHGFTGDQARQDALDGFVTIRGREYPVAPELVRALRDHPAHYDAGVIGPDTLPDLMHGWYLVHTQGNDATEPRGEDTDDSGDTGEWLSYLLRRAWQAQADPAYGPTERAQILAFTYGFLTHPAGDIWAHTLVNDFARGRWPTRDDVYANADNAVIPLRHKIVEAYIGDATPGFDGNPARRPGDASDDMTPARAFAAPHRFLYRTLIDPQARTPGDAAGEFGRGASIDFFLRLRRNLVALRDPSQVQPIRAALDEYDDTRRAWDEAEDDCNYGATSSGAEAIARDIAHDGVACPIAMARLGVTAVVDSFQAFNALRTEAREKAARRVFHSYLNAWIGNIDRGLMHWSELSLAITRAEFDPAARRALQDARCATRGAEGNPLRNECEDAVSGLDVVIEETEDFTNDYLLAMLGLPQFVGDTRSATDDIREEVRARLATLALAFDPILAAVGTIRENARSRVREAIRDAIGIDLEEAERFENPTHWLIDTDPVSVNFPQLGRQTVRLFEPGDHARLDGIMGLAGGHHVHFGVPFERSSGLADDAVFDPSAFAPVANTITTAKLLLLDARSLNQVLGDVLVELGVLRSASAVGTYRDRVERPANLMVDALGGAAEWWLRDINSDHAWRADAPPQGLPSGGTGAFPLWESCALRPAFRALYLDWENGAETFPDLGDGVSPDPATDPEPPHTLLSIEGDFFDDGTRRYVSRTSVLRLRADDVFADSHLRVRYRVSTDPANPGPWIDAAPGVGFSLEGPDGSYHVEFQAEDPCHTFADENGAEPGDPLPPEPVRRETLLLARLGTQGSDVLMGTPGDDVIVGLGGNDVIFGRQGDDLLHGGAGDDVLMGDEGDDLLLGGEGDDRLFGHRGENALEGGEGRDWLFGGPEADTLQGGPGDDLLYGRHGDDALDGGDGNDRLYGQVGDDVLRGGEGTNLLHGGPGHDVCESVSLGDRKQLCEASP